LEERFGIPATVFEPYALLEAGNSWWLLRNSPYLELASRFKVFGCGIKAFQRVSRYVKPTTRLIQLFGGEATKSVVDITDEQLHSLMRGEGMESRLDIENGYVILRLNNRYVLGLGLLIRGIVRSQIRKSYLQQMSTISLQE
jgi:NOL1/NOP2/fmu family ribosome biogenesis protein